MPTGQNLADLLSGAAGAPVDRPALNAFVATSQARNGLVSAQTQDAMIKAQQGQEEQQAHSRLLQELIDSGQKPSDAALTRDFLVGHYGNAETSLKAIGQLKLGYGSPQDQTAGQQMYEGKLAGPVSVPNSFVSPPGSVLSSATIQQSPQGAAQTAQTKALTGLDVARAEDEHAKTKNALSSSVASLSPQALDTAARVVMADPSKMSSYAGYGKPGQANKDAINERISQLLNDSGMSADDMINHRAVAKASVGAAGQAAKQQQTLDAFMPLIKANGDRVLQLMDGIDAAGGPPDEPIINGFSRMLGRALNSDDLAELHSVMTAYQAEVGRLLAAGPSMNGVISDHARDLVNGMAPETMSASQARRVINRIDTETSIRRQGVHQSLLESANAQTPVISPHTPGNTPAPAGASDDNLPPGFHRLN